MSMNIVIIQGRLTKDPELRRTNSGKAVTSFTLAVEDDYQADKSGNNKDVDYIDCVAWQGTAEFVNNYFKKGRMALVHGKLKIRTYEKDGQKRKATEVVVDNVYFSDSKPGSNGGQGNAPQGGQQYGAPQGGGQYGAPQNGGQYGAPQNGGQYGAPQNGGQYGAPQNGGQYGAPQNGGQYGAPQNGGQYGAPQNGGQYGAPQNGGQYGAPQNGQQYVGQTAPQNNGQGGGFVPNNNGGRGNLPF